jgi:hypothetical protein
MGREERGILVAISKGLPGLDLLAEKEVQRVTEPAGHPRRLGKEERVSSYWI